MAAKGGQTGAQSRLPYVPEVWQLDALCREVDPGLFFHPEGERGNDHDGRERAAKAVCARCPVRRECGAAALARRETYGVWGGMTEDERKAIHAQDARRTVLVQLEVAA